MSDEELQHEMAVWYLLRVEYHTHGAARFVRDWFSEVEFDYEAVAERARQEIVTGWHDGRHAAFPIH